MDIQGHPLNFVECESFFESNSPDILALCEKLGWLNWFWQFLCEGYLPLIQKDSITHIHGLAVYMSEGLPFITWDLPLENSTD